MFIFQPQIMTILCLLYLHEIKINGKTRLYPHWGQFALNFAHPISVQSVFPLACVALNWLPAHTPVSNFSKIKLIKLRLFYQKLFKLLTARNSEHWSSLKRCLFSFGVIPAYSHRIYFIRNEQLVLILSKYGSRLPVAINYLFRTLFFVHG